MRLVKALGLAAIAAMGLMAFLGAASASATALCTTTDTPICTSKYSVGVSIHIVLKSGSTAKLTGSGGEVIATCNQTTIQVSIGFAGGSTSTVSGNVGSITQGGCSQTTDTISNGSLEIHYISGTHNGTVTGAGSQVTTQIFGVSCTYGTGTGTHLGTLTGGAEPALNVATTVTKTAGGFLCPSSAGWDAEFVVDSPHALFVTES